MGILASARHSIRRFRRRHYTAFLIVKLVVPVFLTFCLLLLVASSLILYSIVHPGKTPEYNDPQDFKIYPTEIAWQGARGNGMKGWWIRNGPKAPLVVLTHGYEMNRFKLLSLASRLKDEGYNVLLFNLRGHGTSEYAVTSLGLYEGEDLARAVEAACMQPEIDPDRVGIYGTSLGAYAALKAAQKNPRVRAMVLDSAYGNIRTFIDMRVEKIVGIRSSILSSIVALLYEIYFFTSPYSVSRDFPPDDFSDKSVLFITGNDAATAGLAKETRRLYMLVKCRKEIIPTNNSRESLLSGDEKIRYDQMVLDFFKKEIPVGRRAAGGDIVHDTSDQPPPTPPDAPPPTR